MKKFRSLVALLFAVVFSFCMITTASAAGTITITSPSGLADDAENTYKVYKVFNAVGTGTNISYSLCDGDTLSAEMLAAGFSVDTAGNVSGPGSLDAAAIAAIAAYVNDADLVDTVTITGSASAATDELGDGYYYITTSTGTVVTIDSINGNVEVDDKNTVPTLDKTITGASSISDAGKKALAQVGTTVNYKGSITVGYGAKDYVFHDTMETGLTYNSDAKVYIGGVEVDAENYTLGQEGTDTFTITFKNDYIKTLAVGTVLDVVYSAKVNTDAITIDPLNNTAYVSYGDENTDNRTPDSEADVYEAKFTVIKHDGNGQPLAGAGFVVKNSEGKYYKIAIVDENPVVSWVDDIADATEYTSAADGTVKAFTGLANGTYTLVEKTVPAGYNKAADQDFTIAEGDYTAANIEQGATVVNKSGTELPSTGGMGTTFLYIIGGILVIGAGVLLITKRRMVNE